MFSFVKKCVPFAFLSLPVVLGFCLYGIPKSVPTAPAPVVETTVSTSEPIPESTMPAPDPFVMSVSTEPIDEPADELATLLPSDAAFSWFHADPAPIVCRNADEEATKPIAVKPLPPEAHGITQPPKPEEKKVEKTEPCGSKWIPFVYFYQKSRNCCTPDRILYVFPLTQLPLMQPSMTEIADAPVAGTPVENEPVTPESVPCSPLIPVIYGPMPVVYPVYPVYSQAVPVFTPNVVPSRFGAPKWVYPNGVVVKPKVYIPGQPVKNTLRAVTP